MSAVQYSPVVVFATGLSGWANGWENIQPTRKYIPLAIQRKEAELVEAEESLALAADVNEEARTDASVDNLGLARERVRVIALDLQAMRDLFYQHPDAFEEDSTCTQS